MESDKQEIRRAVLRVRNDLSLTERKKGDILLTERILGHQWFYGSKVLLCYVNFGSEIATSEILQEALRRGKQVYVPKVVQEARTPEMKFFRIASLEELQEGYMGICEPDGNSEEYRYEANLETEEAKSILMLMPGVAFDRLRGRLGYGKGFYDRFLQDKPQLQQRTIGVGYGCQLVEQLPVSDYDIKPYQVICV